MIQKAVFNEVFNHFFKYHMKIVLGDFNARGERIFSNGQLGIRLYIRIAMKMVLE
jgi:hypothetical protein